MRVIGLTGSIASGKSEAASRLRAKGCAVIDADEISHSVLDTPDIISRVLECFPGQDILGSDGLINRKALAGIVFGDKGELEKLEAIIHPAVGIEFGRLRRSLEEAGEAFVFYDCPLLFEKNLLGQVDRVLLIHASKEAQAVRLMRRDGLGAAAAEARIALQMGCDEKVAQSDYVIFNDGTVEQLHRAVDAFAAMLMEEERNGL